MYVRTYVFAIHGTVLAVLCGVFKSVLIMLSSSTQNRVFCIEEIHRMGGIQNVKGCLDHIQYNDLVQLGCFCFHLLYVSTLLLVDDC